MPSKLLSQKNNTLFLGWFVLLIIIGAVIRVAIAQRGYNFDISSYRIVADIAASGGNVYVETQRYNYGPIWFYILTLLDYLPFPISDPLLSLRWKVSSFLTLTDIAIAICLYRWYGFKIASLFFLNPISIIITGYHSQFDNLAILMGLISIKALESENNSLSNRALYGLVLLGISLSIKHVLFLFPLWLAFKAKNWRAKLLTIAIPYVIFLATFLPFLPKGLNGVLNHVFLYRGYANAPFWYGIVPSVIVDKLPIFILFIGSLIFLGLGVRAKKPLESFYIYTIALVIFSSTVANQYLAISIIAISTHWNISYLLYSIAGTIYLLASGDGLHIKVFQHYLGSNGSSSVIGYKELILLLFLGLIQQLLSTETKEYLLIQFKSYACCLKSAIIRQIKVPW